MADIAAATAALRGLPLDSWAGYLGEHSGLPGPRANLTLVAAVAALADTAVIDELLCDDGEYTTMCAAAALGRHADDPRFEKRARGLAGDGRWRVREGVAIGLQLLGDVSPAALTSIVLTWAADPSPLVQRAAVAAICETRLLRTAEAATTSIEVCRRTSRQLAALPDERRAQPDARALRQALGYCWSVAVAADPSAGLPVFQALDTADPDIAWIVNQNRHKKRLSRLL